jgi:FkbM family methyltransferase
MKIIQIGANSGNDNVQQFITDHKEDIDLAILVEPIPFVLDKLKENYKDFPNVIIENLAISDKETEKLTLYYEKDSNYELSSFRKQHLIDCRCDLNKIESLDINCLTINQLFDKYELTEIDYLYIDTEGLDVYIVNSIDFNKFKIKNIIFEAIHADGTQQIGTNYKQTIEHLKKLGYDLSPMDVLNIKATLHENNL